VLDATETQDRQDRFEAAVANTVSGMKSQIIQYYQRLELLEQLLNTINRHLLELSARMDRLEGQSKVIHYANSTENN
jgi:hypothetical protein